MKKEKYNFCQLFSHLEISVVNRKNLVKNFIVK